MKKKMIFFGKILRKNEKNEFLGKKWEKNEKMNFFQKNEKNEKNDELTAWGNKKYC